jgi:hypothetical protein
MSHNQKSTKLCTSLETWTLTNSRQKLVDHYAQMAMNPATLGQARWRTRELEADLTGLWIGIGSEIAMKLKELKDEKEKQIQA